MPSGAREIKRRGVAQTSEQSAIVGIDLGTTNSLIAVVQDRVPRVLDVDGGPLLPSVVGMDAAGELLVGTAARNQWVAAPERTVRSIKRRMGERDYTVALGDTHHTPEEISAHILRRLAARATPALAGGVRQAVITVPAYFAQHQRQATMRAGELAGLEVVRLLNEPTAAALAYGLDRAGAETVLVYDLGGGTFDVSVVELGDGVTEVRASHGNRQLGGDDFDALILDELANAFHQRHGVDLRGNRQAMARLSRAAEAAKLRLSDHPYATIREEFLAEKDGRPLHLEAELTRSRFEELIAPLLDGTLEAVRRALRDAELDARALDAVLLVGGSTRIPAVRDLVAEELGCQPRQDVHPELAVALGAAVSGALAAGVDVGTVLVDVCPHSLGVSAVGLQAGQYSEDVFVPLIRRNTVIPVSRSEFFYTLTPDQTAVNVEVYQGEELVASRNTRLGAVRFEGLSKAPDGGQREVLVAFDYDVNGILHVAAVDRRTGRKREAHLHTAALSEVAATGGEDEVLRQRLERLRGNVPETAAQRLRGLLERQVAAGEAAAWREEAADFLLEYGGEY